MTPEPPHHSHVVRHLRRHTEARKLADHWAEQVALGEAERGETVEDDSSGGGTVPEVRPPA